MQSKFGWHRIILTKWYANNTIMEELIKELKSIILTKWYVNNLSCKNSNAFALALY